LPLNGLSFSIRERFSWLPRIVHSDGDRADNVVEPENNIGVVAPLYCDVVTMYLHRFGGVTIVESGVIVNAVIKTVMVTIAEIVWHCCASFIRIYVALSKLRAVIYVMYISMLRYIHA